MKALQAKGIQAQMAKVGITQPRAPASVRVCMQVFSNTLLARVCPSHTRDHAFTRSTYISTCIFITFTEIFVTSLNLKDLSLSVTISLMVRVLFSKT